MGLSEAFLEEKDKTETQPVDLYEFKINGIWYYYAHSRADVIYDGQTYVAWAVNRSEISRTADGRADKVTITLDNTSRGYTSLSQFYRLTGCECNIRQVFRNLLTAGNDRLIFSGYLANPAIDGLTFSVDVVQYVYTLQIQCPRRMYQRYCNSRFGDVSCVTYAGIADSGGTTIRLNDAALDRPSHFFCAGTLTILSGANAGQTRMVSDSGVGFLTWTEALASAISEGDTYTVTWKALSYNGLTVDSGTTTSLTDNVLPYGDDGVFWVDGYVHITNGANAGQRRRITACASHSVEWVLPLAYPLVSSPITTYAIYRGCDKTLEGCARFNNQYNFSGFTEIADVQNLRRYGE